MVRDRKILLTDTCASTHLSYKSDEFDRLWIQTLQFTIFQELLNQSKSYNFSNELFYNDFSFVVESGGLTAYEKQAIVDAHNRLRQSVALGQVSSQPPAANMMEMVSYQLL